MWTYPSILNVDQMILKLVTVVASSPQVVGEFEFVLYFPSHLAPVSGPTLAPSVEECILS